MVVCPVHKSAKKTPAPVWSKTMNGDEALAVTTANHFTAPVRPCGAFPNPTHCFISNAPVTVQTDYPSLLSINRPTHRPIQ